MNKGLILSILLFFFLLNNIFAQVGINTQDPLATLDVLSTANTAESSVLITSNSDNTETLKVKNDGAIGTMTVSNPLVKLDVRGKDGIIGVGYADISAVEAKGGAIRYNPSLKELEYSDGVSWFQFRFTPQKAFVVVTHSKTWSFPTYGGSSTTFNGPIENWDTPNIDKTNSFDAKTGLFTAPNEGLYSFTVNVVFDKENVTPSSYAELNISVPGVGALKTVVPFFQSANSVPISFSVRDVIYLSKGDQRSVRLFLSGFSASPKVAADAALNVMTIVEL